MRCALALNKKNGGSSKLWRWWPQRLGSRLVAVVLLGVLAAHAVALFVAWRSSEVINPVSQAQVVERVVVAYRVASATDTGEDFGSLLWAVGTDDARFWIEDVDGRPLRPMTEPELRIAESLGRYLPEVPFEDISVQLDRSGHQGNVASGAHMGWSLADLSIALPLPNGQWLYSYQQPLAGYQWIQLLGFSLPVSILIIVAVVLLAIYWMVRPLHALAGVAERISRGERIKQLNISGPKETQELAQAFNTMQRALMDYVEDRTRMLAAISHDIRTPITSLRLRAEMLPPGKSRDAMIRTLEHMQEMAEETLRFARDDAVRESTEDVDLTALIDQLVVDARANGQNIGWTSTNPAICRGRPLALRRAVQNLLDNALRFGHRIELRLLSGSMPGHPALPSGNPVAWTIQMDDDGPGLAPELLERAFEPFFQADTARSHQGGSSIGLGLSIARSCVQAHGGLLTLENLPQGGLRASIQLP